MNPATKTQNLHGMPQFVRIGVVHKGALIVETCIEKHSDIKVGVGRDCAVRVPKSAWPHDSEGVALLRWLNGWHAVIPAEGQLQLRGEGDDALLTTTIGGQKCLALLQSDGRLVPGGSRQIGELTVMFQFVRDMAMPLVTRERTVLRVGLVHADRLISEQVFADAAEVCIGPRTRDSIVLPEYEGAAVCVKLARDGSATLLVPVGLEAVIAQGSATQTPGQRVLSGRASRKGDVLHCAMHLNERARVRMGAYTVLVQIVTQQLTVATPVPRKPLRQLQDWLVRDAVWNASLFGATALVAALVGQALLYESKIGRFAKDTAAAETPDREVLMVELPPEKPEIDAPKEVDVRPIAPPAQPEPKKPTKPEPSKPKQPAKVTDAENHNTAAKQDNLDAEHNRRAVLDKSVVGAFVGANGQAARLFAPDESGEATQQQKAFNGGPNDGQPGAPGQMRLDLPAGSAGSSPEVVAANRRDFGVRDKTVSAPVVAKRSEPIFKLGPLDGGPDDGPEGKDASSLVGKVITRKSAAVKRCYETALRDNPTVSGKVVIRFTVGTAGTVTDADVRGAAGAFADCIRGVFLTARGLPILSAPRSFTQSYVFDRPN